MVTNVKPLQFAKLTAITIAINAIAGIALAYDSPKLVQDPLTGAYVLERTPEQIELDKQAAAQAAAHMRSICKNKGVFEQYYQECILSNMPSVRSRFAVAEVYRHCLQKAPCNIIKKQRSGLFGVTTAHECFQKYGARQTIPDASVHVQMACHDLYVDQ